MLNRRIVLSAVLIMGMAAAAFATSGWSVTGPERTMYLTFSKAVALPGATLGAGTYVFEMANPSTSGDVSVSGASSVRVVCVTLGEANRNGAPRIAAWFPLGESFGYRFRYRE